MPTPFTHLQITNRIYHDTALPNAVRTVLHNAQPDFLLGGVVADARAYPGADRSITHFYTYDRPMPDNPWREMLRQHPSLTDVKSPEQAAFLAGYVAHLAADEYWSHNMLKPHFANSDWGAGIRDRFYILHLLLIHMDERDEAQLPDNIPAIMRQSTPHHWLPFMDDRVICDWRDFIAQQLEGESETLNIFGGRISTPPEKVREMLDNPTFMQQRLWDNVTPETVAKIEADLYIFAREQMLTYLQEYDLIK